MVVLGESSGSQWTKLQRDGRAAAAVCERDQAAGGSRRLSQSIALAPVLDRLVCRRTLLCHPLAAAGQITFALDDMLRAIYHNRRMLPRIWSAATSTKLSARQRGAGTPDLRAAPGRTLL